MPLDAFEQEQTAASDTRGTVDDVTALANRTAKEFDLFKDKTTDLSYQFVPTAKLTPAQDADANNIADVAGTGKWIVQATPTESKILVQVDSIVPLDDSQTTHPSRFVPEGTPPYAQIQDDLWLGWDTGLDLTNVDYLEGQLCGTNYSNNRVARVTVQQIRDSITKGNVVDQGVFDWVGTTRMRIRALSIADLNAGKLQFASNTSSAMFLLRLTTWNIVTNNGKQTPVPTSFTDLGDWNGVNLQNEVRNGMLVGTGAGAAGIGAPHGAFTGSCKITAIGDWIQQDFLTANAPGTVVGERFSRQSFDGGTTWSAWFGQ